MACAEQHERILLGYFQYIDGGTPAANFVFSAAMNSLAVAGRPGIGQAGAHRRIR